MKLVKMSMEKQDVEQFPNMELAYWYFLLKFPENNNETLLSKLIANIKKYNMAPWYKIVCSTLRIKFDLSLYEDMETRNLEELKKFDEIIDDAKKLLDETELRKAYLKKAEYYISIGDKENAVCSFVQVFDLDASIGEKIEIVFHLMRIGFFFMDVPLIKNYLEVGQIFEENEVNWESINRFKVYEALYCILIRNFKTASDIILDAIITFITNELIDYRKFVSYGIYASIVTLPRKQLIEKMSSPEILEVLNSDTNLKKICFAVCNCSYNDIFLHMARLEQILQEDYFFHSHYGFYISEMKFVIYSQCSNPYKTVSFDYLANTLGVTPEYIEEDFSRYIKLGRLPYKVDKIHGIVEQNSTEKRNATLSSIMKEGDLLLNRIQKLVSSISI